MMFVPIPIICGAAFCFVLLLMLYLFDPQADEAGAKRNPPYYNPPIEKVKNTEGKR